jgi:N-acetyl-anhydromuramyl-L-alanine amidase AmpD
MIVETCLLDRKNSLVADGVSIGDRIRVSGKEHLWDDRSGADVDTVVIHYASAVNVNPQEPFDRAAILKIFCDYGVSSHYLIDRHGGVFQLAPEEKRAWHAGGSIMPEPDNRKAVNGFSIGIELMATADSGFTREQYGALLDLCGDIEKRHGKRFVYVGHDQISGERAVKMGVRKDPKVDPGKLFNWSEFLRRLDERRIIV